MWNRTNDEQGAWSSPTDVRTFDTIIKRTGNITRLHRLVVRPRLHAAQQLVVVLVGGSVVLVGIAILVADFLWAGRWLKKARALLPDGGNSSAEFSRQPALLIPHRGLQGGGGAPPGPDPGRAGSAGARGGCATTTANARTKDWRWKCRSAASGRTGDGWPSTSRPGPTRRAGNGEINWRGTRRHVGEAFVGDHVGLKPGRRGVSRVHLGPVLVGELHDDEQGGIRLPNGSPIM